MNEEERVLPRMSIQQFKQAKALIKGICCNYDSVTGGCLLLDLGEVVQCPQMLSQSLCCKYFRDVLLEDKRAQDLKAEITANDYVKTCTVCGQLFQAVSNRAKYCTRCAVTVKREQATKRKQKQRSNVTH